MNLATGSMTFGRNHRFVFGSLIAALLAVVILTGIAVWQIAGTGSSVTAVAPVVAPASVPAVDTTNRSVTPTHYYLVNSQAQADAVAEAEFEAQMNNAGLGTVDPTSYVIDISTPEGQQQAWMINAELQQIMLDDASFDASLVQIFDLTVGAGLANTSAGSGFTPADVPAASTLYIVASEAEKETLVQAAFEAASFEGIANEDVAPNVMVVGSPEQEHYFNMMLNEASTAPEWTVNIVDLR